MGRHSLASPDLQPSMQQPESAVPALAAETYMEMRQGEVIDASRLDPILTADEAAAVFGFPSGALQAVIRLPYRYSIFADGKTPSSLVGDEGFADFLKRDATELNQRMNNVTVYCFKSPEVAGRRIEGSSDYYIMGGEQIKQLREQALYGPSSLPDTSGGVIGLMRGQFLPIGRGNGKWLPNVGWDYPLLKEHDEELRSRYAAVSHDQAIVWIGDQGELLIKRSEKSRYHEVPTMFVGVGRSNNN